jgi:uncharacterized protein
VIDSWLREWPKPAASDDSWGISRIDDVYAYHASIDGVRWQLVLAFVLALEGVSPSISLEAQSPTGEGCTATFRSMSFTPTRLADIRDGT